MSWSKSRNKYSTHYKKEFNSNMKNGLLIFSAPSGSGKSTIVNWLMKEHPELKLAFSISCTSRAPRGTEKNGVEYFFLTPEEFKAKIEADEFLEYEEVYQDRFYGTLKSQVENQLNAGESVMFDVDVKGWCQHQEVLWRTCPQYLRTTSFGRGIAPSPQWSWHRCTRGHRATPCQG